MFKLAVAEGWAGSLGPAVLPVSVVVSGLICEYMAFLGAREEASRARAGLGRRIASRVVAKRLGEGRVARVSVIGEVLGVPLAAAPDMALLGNDGKVTHLFKASVRSPPRRTRTDLAYLRLSALLLDLQGALAGDARLVVISASSAEKLKTVLEEASTGDVKPLKTPDALVYVEVYEKGRALEEASKLLEPLRGVRPPRPNPSPRTCPSCRYSSLCEYSAAKP